VSRVVPFTDPKAQHSELAGGKGANLPQLVAAGFTVPPGFVVLTSAYADALADAGLADEILGIVGRIDYDDVDGVERASAEIRRLIEGLAVPEEIVNEIKSAYAAFGSDVSVAVRSSGTAEDTADASFAGLHDTYLDIHGADEVVNAVRRCWASMWTARAISYRHTKGFDHAQARIAVVVQQMVESEVAGVMFTGHPLRARTDEIVVNASYGLGEAVVSGLVTPDEFTLNAHTLEVKHSHTGSKAKKIVRSPSGVGTVTLDVDEADRARLCLTPEQLAELGDLGRRVTRHYDCLPQDIEWGYADGTFHLLQSRPITGVDFTWDEGIEEWQTAPEDEDSLWTYKYSEQYWNGGITPLFYSIRAREPHEGIMRMAELAGFHDLTNKRTYKYKFGTAYYGVEVDEAFQRYALPRAVRAAGAFNVPENILPKTLSEPLDVVRFLRMMLSVNASPTSAFYNWRRAAREKFIFNSEKIAEANGLPDSELRRLSDTELRRYLRSLEDLAIKFMDSLWVGTHIPMPMIFGLFGTLVAKYYKGDNPTISQDLMSGLPPTLQTKETHDFYELAQRLRQSKSLRKVFDENPGATFFEALKDSEEGREFLEAYRAFVAEHGHRGHQDRDIYFKRRADDPAIDYEAFRLHLQSENDTPPWENERRLIEKREAATKEIMEHLGVGVFGGVRQKLFQLLHEEIIDFLVLREDWRYYIDRITYSKRRVALEVGRRCVERGSLDQVEDCFFLGEDELFRTLAGAEPLPLTRAKVRGRRRHFERMESRTWTPPMLIKGDGTVVEDVNDVGEGGSHMVGIGTSAGVVEARARVVRNLSEIGTIQRGEILVCNATDPGWAPVFSVISGLVIETGGMLAHGSCLSREHGIPAVQLVNGMRLIPNGALIRINGTTGEVDILDTGNGVAEVTANEQKVSA